MRKIYFIRHAKPDFPNNERHCVGRTDMPIGTVGRLQCVLMSHYPALQELRGVYSSYLSRAHDTAGYLSETVKIVNGLEEMYAGEWDGLSFSEIKSRYPELYALREHDRSISLPGSEDIHAGAARFREAVDRIVNNSSGDIAIVAHSTVIKSFIAQVRNTPIKDCRSYSLPYCSYAVFEYNGDYRCSDIGIRPALELDKCICHELLDAAECPKSVIEHCNAVCLFAEELCDTLNEAGLSLDRSLISAAALLHDIARTEDNHPQLGALWLDELGYKQISSIIAQHHDLLDESIGEAAVVYLADKCVCGAERVRIDERFERSRRKYNTPQAQEAVQMRYDLTIGLKNKINNICGKDAVL